MSTPVVPAQIGPCAIEPFARCSLPVWDSSEFVPLMRNASGMWEPGSGQVARRAPPPRAAGTQPPLRHRPAVPARRHRRGRSAMKGTYSTGMGPEAACERHTLGLSGRGRRCAGGRCGRWAGVGRGRVPAESSKRNRSPTCIHAPRPKPQPGEPRLACLSSFAMTPFAERSPRLAVLEIEICHAGGSRR